MTPTLQLIAKVKDLLRLTEGTQLQGSQTVMDVYDAINKAQAEQDKLKEIYDHIRSEFNANPFDRFAK